jgi:hypothetical protein
MTVDHEQEEDQESQKSERKRKRKRALMDSTLLTTASVALPFG